MAKTEYVHIRCTLDEKKQIRKMAKQLGYDSMSDYIVTISVSGIPRKDRSMLFTEVHNLRMRNTMIENNINQIAKHLNTFKSIDDKKLDDYLSYFKDFIKIRGEQTEAIKRLNKLL